MQVREGQISVGATFTAWPFACSLVPRSRDVTSRTRVVANATCTWVSSLALLARCVASNCADRRVADAVSRRAGTRVALVCAGAGEAQTCAMTGFRAYNRFASIHEEEMNVVLKYNRLFAISILEERHNVVNAMYELQIRCDLLRTVMFI